MLPRANNEWSLQEAAHLMRRAGFGGSPTEIHRIHQLGREAAVDGLLNPDEPIDAIPVPDWAEPQKVATQRRERFAMIREARMAQRDMMPKEREEARREMRREMRREQRRNLVDAGDWWFDRMMRSRAPLREKMVLFLHDHFATSAQKVRRPVLMLAQNQLFRKHAFGDFRELTHEIAVDPAMMLYLDTHRSKKGNPNENFAREVMELFTLGEGHYTEQDIKEAARAFTGYQLNPIKGEVTHNKRQWDRGPKTVLGKSGNFNGARIIDLLFEQEAAAHYLPSKWWTFFVEDEAPKAVVAELAKTFKASGFRIKPVLREIFLSRAFYDGPVIRNQIKSPVQFLVQLGRELEIDELPRGYVLTAQRGLGQQLFHPPNVAGWDWGRAWINTNTLLNRYHTAGLITKGAIDVKDDQDEGGSMRNTAAAGGRPGQRIIARMMKRSMERWKGPDYETIAPRALRKKPAELVEALIDRLFQADPGDKQRRIFVAYAKAKKPGEFTDREVAELCHLMMSTPHYQLC